MLIGVKCDSEDHYGEKRSFDACLNCALGRDDDPTRSCHNSYQVIKAMSMNKVERKDAGLSATMVTAACPRQTCLEQQVDFYEHPKDVYPRVRGTVHHLLIEQYSEGLEPYIAELRLKKSIDIFIEDEVYAIEVTGKPDMVLPDSNLIIDYKSTKDIRNPYKDVTDGVAVPEHEAQVNIYAWLLDGGTAVHDYNDGGFNFRAGDKVNVDIKYGGIQYMDMMSQFKCAVNIWSKGDQYFFIQEQIMPLLEYKLTEELPPILMKGNRRHPFCNFCAVREECDELAKENK